VGKGPVNPGDSGRFQGEKMHEIRATAAKEKKDTLLYDGRKDGRESRILQKSTKKKSSEGK